MRLETNQIYIGTTALFNESLFPKCTTQKCRGTTRIDEPESAQPPLQPQPVPSGLDDDEDHPFPSHPLPFSSVPKVLPPSPQKQREKTPSPGKEKVEFPPPHPARSPRRERQPLPRDEGQSPQPPLEPLPPLTPTPSH